MPYKLKEIRIPTVGQSRHAVDLVFESIPTAENRHVGCESVRLKQEFSPLKAQGVRDALRHLCEEEEYVWEEIPRTELAALRSIPAIVSVLTTQRWKPPSLALI